MTEDKIMTDEQYKKLSIDEFTKAAAKYEGNHAGIYEILTVLRDVLAREDD